MAKTWTLIMMAALLFSGCAEKPLPKFMNEETVKQITVGKTTESEVLTLLGRPQQTRTVDSATDASTIWTYQYVQRGRRNWSPACKRN